MLSWPKSVILIRGKASKKLKITVPFISKKAKEMIEKTGSTVITQEEKEESK